jgi:DNA-binding transcriptional LysR family regulator
LLRSDPTYHIKAMEPRYLQTFKQVAELHSFSKAAVALGYAQSSVTNHIQVLETELGVRLFERNNKQVKLTDAGKRLLAYSSRLLALADEARAAVSNQSAGEVTISAPETLCTYRLPPLLLAIRDELPHIRVIFRPLAAHELRQRVRSGDIDLAFVLEPAQESAGLRVEALTEEAVGLVASPLHRLNGAESISPQQLMHEHLLLTEASCSYRRLFERTLFDAGVVPQERFELQSVEAIKQLAIAGLGIAVLPEIALRRELEEGLLVKLPWSGVPLRLKTQMVWNPDRWHPAEFGGVLRLARRVVNTM